MIEDYLKVASIRIPIQQVMQLHLGTIIILKNHQVKFTKRIIKTHMGIYVHAIVPNELLNNCNMINKDVKYRIEDIRQMNVKDIMYIDIYGELTAIRRDKLDIIPEINQNYKNDKKVVNKDDK